MLGSLDYIDLDSGLIQFSANTPNLSSLDFTAILTISKTCRAPDGAQCTAYPLEIKLCFFL